LFVWRQCADAILLAEVQGAVFGRNMDGFDRIEPCFHQQLDLALIAEARKHSTVSSWIGTREQKAASFDEGDFEIHLFA